RRSAEPASRRLGDTVDSLLTHRLLGLPVFALVVFLVFSMSQTWLGPGLAELVAEGVDAVYGAVAGLMAEWQVSPVLASLLLDGVIGGVGAVLGFLPLIMVLFFFLALLEDSGYMA